VNISLLRIMYGIVYDIPTRSFCCASVCRRSAWEKIMLVVINYISSRKPFKKWPRVCLFGGPFVARVAESPDVYRPQGISVWEKRKKNLCLKRRKIIIYRFSISLSIIPVFGCLIITILIIIIIIIIIRTRTI